MTAEQQAALPVFDTPAEMRAWADMRRSAGRVVGLVPTMGALHAGHIALIEAARNHAADVVVSIFVNPLQFNRRDDFDAYPRLVDHDIAICAQHGATAIYAPTQAAMYPAGFETHVEPGPTAAPMEGAGRPGHFRGVTTVVAKLFNAVRPDVAVFGQKDFQQLAVIRRMVTDLDMGIRIIGLSTVREPDGLAMSSRNRRLTVAQRADAVVVPHALDTVSAAVAAGVVDPTELRTLVADLVATAPTARLEYVDLVDPDTLADVDKVELPTLVAIAVWFGDVRLIDNRIISRQIETGQINDR